MEDFNGRSTSKITSKGGLLNPDVFSAGNTVKVLFNIEYDARVLMDRSYKPGHENIIYRSLKLPFVFYEGERKGSLIMLKGYVAQLAELLKRNEEGLISFEDTVFYLSPSHLNGYDWLKPFVYYDEDLTKEIGVNIDREEANIIFDNYLSGLYLSD